MSRLVALVDEIANELVTWPGVRIERRADGAALVRYEHSELGVLYRDQGVVLRTIKLGESDRIITLVTAGHGKVRAVAKGVRKTKSRFGARLEPLSHASLLVYEGRDLDIISQAESIDHFRAIREDLDRMGSAMALLEAVDQVIAAFGLERFRHHRTAELSTGTRRVVDLASIVLAHPRLLLLDEPTAGIAQREAEAFIPLLRRLHQVADTTIVLVEHDVPLVFELCSTVVVMSY